MINIRFDHINYNTTNSKNDARSRSSSTLSICQDMMLRVQTVGGYLLPRTVAYYTNDQIKKDRISQISLTFLEKGWLGVKMQLAQLLPLICVHSFIVVPILNRALDVFGFPDEIEDASEDICEYGVGLAGIVCPFIEEIIFRGIIQNCVSAAQKTMRVYLPSCLRGRITDWMTSPQARVLTVNALFGAVHLTNAGMYLSSRAAIRQMIIHMIFSQEAGLYETADSLIVPFAAHATTNTLIYSVTCSFLNHFK